MESEKKYESYDTIIVSRERVLCFQVHVTHIAIAAIENTSTKV